MQRSESLTSNKVCILCFPRYAWTFAGCPVAASVAIFRVRGVAEMHGSLTWNIRNSLPENNAEMERMHKRWYTGLVSGEPRGGFC